VDINRLTMADVSTIEELAGQPITAMTDDDKPKGKLMTAIAYVMKRHDDPAFTFADAGKLTMGDLNALLDAEVDPESTP
jgi:hypothetical protein